MLRFWLVFFSTLGIVNGFQQAQNVIRGGRTQMWSTFRPTEAERLASHLSRRRNIAQVLAWMGLVSTTSVSAEEQIAETPILQGSVVLGTDVELTASSKTSALYITCRPDKPDNVPGAILTGTRGKPPPVMAARFENPAFPFEFSLSSPKDLTVEGASDGIKSTATLDPALFWWNKDDLVVSARWDSDGVAATRSPEDLVGRGTWKRGVNSVEVPLTGRGAFGKFATSGSKK